MERGSGMVEYPSVAQLPRILREEGIGKEAIERAFGKGLKPNNGTQVRKGYMAIGNTTASEYVGPEKALFGKIHITGPGVDTFKTFTEFHRIAASLGIDPQLVTKAFGHVSKTAKMSEGESAGEPLVYGYVVPGKPPTFRRVKRARLGHASRHGFSPGVKKGSLALLDTRTPIPVWAVVEEEGAMRNASTNRVLSFSSVMDKAKKLGIPLTAVLQAFGHLIKRHERSELLSEIHRTPWIHGKNAG